MLCTLMDLLSYAFHKHSCRSQHISVSTTTFIFMFRLVCTIEPSFFKTTSGMHRLPFEIRHFFKVWSPCGLCSKYVLIYYWNFEICEGSASCTQLSVLALIIASSHSPAVGRLLLSDSTVQAIARQSQLSPAQVLLCWALQRNLGTCL